MTQLHATPTEAQGVLHSAEGSRLVDHLLSCNVAG